MKIKRYFAKDMRQAIARVRDEQGPDAVILSNRKIDGGVEVVAAVDYDESLFSASLLDAGDAPTADAEPPRQPAKTRAAPKQPAPTPTAATARPVWEADPAIAAMREEMNAIRNLLETQLSGLAWGELGKRKPTRSALLRKLADLQLSPQVVRETVSRIAEGTDLKDAWRKALGLLAHRIQETDDRILADGGVVALVGPTGVGKTTTVAKLAARFALRHGPQSVALVTTDTFRVGAVEQLRTYARIMGVPVRVANGTEDLRAALEDLYDRRLVLIDTAGVGQRDQRLGEQLGLIQSGSPLVQTYLVLSAVCQRHGLDEAVQAFRQVPLEGCIVTKIDESTGLGGLLSTLIENQLPLAYLTDGQRVPEDIQAGRAHALVSKTVNLAGRQALRADDTDLEIHYGGLVANGSL